MKIALVGKYGEGDIIAGPERVARELYSKFGKNNITVIFIEYFFSEYSNSSVLKKLYGKKINENNIYRLGIIPLLLLLSKGNFDIIHLVNSQRFSLFILLLKRFIKGKLISTLHGFIRYEIPDKNFFTKRYFIDLWVENYIIKKSDSLIFPSKLLFETFNNYYNNLNEKSRIIHPGVSSLFFNQTRELKSFNSPFKIVVYNGFNDTIKKGLIELIELLEMAKYKIELYVFGNESKVKSTRNVSVVYSGSMTHEDLIAFLQDKHFIIKSPAFESFSIIIAECMTLGLIPIINDNVGITNFIKHKINGFIYNHKSREDLSNLINDIYNNKYDLKKISSFAKRIYDKLNWGQIAKLYIDVYQMKL